MNKLAILIDSSNVQGETDLPGARLDISNWQRFLRSPLGGSWTESQIIVLKKPLLAELDSAMNRISEGYCFIAFSGHGSEGSVALNDRHEICSIARLRPRTKKGTLIIDSCRGVSSVKSATFLGESRATEVVLNSRQGRTTDFAEIVKKSDHAPSARIADSTFDDELRDALSGIVTMFSCAKGQSAGEDSEAGGYYTSALMDAANRFLDSHGNKRVLLTKEAHDHAAAIVPAPQAPEYSPAWLNFPFAVRLAETRRFGF